MPDATLPQTVLHREVFKNALRPEPENLARLAEMMENDYQFRLGILTIQSLIESAGASIEVIGDTRARILADNLLAHFKGMLPHALRAVVLGRSAFEKTYALDPKTGLALVAGLDYLPFENTRLILTDKGSFGGIELRSGDRRTRLDPIRSWWFALDPSVTEPHGRSRLLGAPFRVHRQRQQLEELEEV